ncbi:MAG: hypothetical protein RIQ46_1477 [Pseudomonadota bacterium]|jgi:predicted alpha/beta hydrolase family esterase
MANPESIAGDPLVLIVPGLENSGPAHWQSIWERQRGDCERVELGMWDRPHRNTWVNQLNLAIRSANRPVVLVAHSLGCLAVAWWAQLEQPAADNPVIGALLVAPPDVDFFPLDDRLTAFSPTPSQPLPFPAILVGSHSDPYLGYRAARRLARTWGCRFADAGRVGHINAESGIGEWPFGQFLLEQILRRGGGEDRRRDAGLPPRNGRNTGEGHLSGADFLPNQ